MFFGGMSIGFFVYVQIGLLGFMLLSCRSSSHILDITPLLDTRFANSFSHSDVCLFIFLIVSFDVQNWYFFKSPIYLFFSSAMCDFGERNTAF